RLQAMVRVVLPLAAPGLLAAGLFCFTLSWNEFLYALIFIADDSLKTLPVGLSEFVVSDFAFWGQLMAAAALASLPVIVVYIYLHKYMVQGLTAGGGEGGAGTTAPPEAGGIKKTDPRCLALRVSAPRVRTSNDAVSPPASWRRCSSGSPSAAATSPRCPSAPPTPSRRSTSHSSPRSITDRPVLRRRNRPAPASSSAAASTLKSIRSVPS